MSAASEKRWKRKLIAENNEIGALRTQREAMTLVRGERRAPPPTEPGPSRGRVRRWMRLHAGEHDTATGLAEAANAALDLPQAWLDSESHWIWDEALRSFEEPRA